MPERLLARFGFDTSGYVNGLNGHYRRPVFQGVWDAIADGMDNGVIVSPSEVMEEIRRRADADLYSWTRDHEGAFLPPDASWNEHFAEIERQAPHWFAGTGNHDADPFVVAQARASGLIVVTYEGQKFSGETAKISTYKRSMPHVCAATEVEVATFIEVLDYLGLKL